MKSKAKELINTVVLGAAKGLSAVAQTNPILAIVLTVLESLLEKFFDYDKEERDKSADALKSLGKAEIKKLIDIQDKRLEKYSGMLADLTKEFCTSIEEIKERDLKNLNFIKKELLSIITKRLDDNQESLAEELQELKKLLKEALLYIKNDPSECLVMPSSLKPGKEEFITTMDLLRYSRQWIPLTGRDSEMKDLMKFADAPDTFSWWGVQGPGGCGKSRLALEWVLELKKMGWKAGFIRKDNSKDDLNGFITATDWLPMRDTVIVVDYGHEISDFLPGFIKDIINRLQGKECAKLKLLVLDRASSGESWWLTTMDQSSFEGAREVEKACFKTKPIKNKYGNIEKLKPILINIEKINSTDDQVQIIHNSIRQFKKDNNYQVQSAEALLPLIEHFAEGRPLYLIMLGISIAQRGINSVKDLSREEILDDFIKHEVDIWQKYFGESHKIDQVAYDIGFITLCNGLPSSALDKLPASSGEQRKRDRDYRIKLKNVLYVEKKEDGEEFIKPLVPDILGERFVLTGGAGKGKEPYFNASDWIETCLELAPDGLGQTIVRTFQDFDQLDIISEWLDIAFCKIPDDYDEEIFSGFLSDVLILVLIGLQREHKFEERAWFDKYKNLTLNNRNLARHFAELIPFLLLIYGSKDNWSKIEEWWRFLIKLRTNPLFKNDREIALSEANAEYSAILVFSDTQKWEELEKWGNRIKALRKIGEFKTDWEIAFIETEAAVKSILAYCSAQKWEDLEEWGNRIKTIREIKELANNKEIALKEAQLAVNIISAYGETQKWVDLERWGKRITDLREIVEFRADPDISIEEAKVAVNAIIAYSKVQNLEKIEEWGNWIYVLREIESLKTNREIALQEAKAGTSAILVYGQIQKWADLERWGKRIKALREIDEFRTDPEIANSEANAVFNAILAYSKAHKWKELEEWGDKLIDLRGIEEFRTNREIAFTEAEVAYNVISAYGEVQNWKELEEWGDRIKALSEIENFRTDPRIALAEARAVSNAISVYGDSQKWDDLERWGDRLKFLKGTEKFRTDPGIALVEVSAAFNAIFCYGKARMWNELEKWGERIKALRRIEELRTNREIALAETMAAYNAISVYSIGQNWKELEEWGDRLKAIRGIKEFVTDREIALQEAKSALNAISAYGEAHKWKDLEKWGNRIKALREIEIFRTDPGIALAEVSAAFNAILFYGKAQKWMELEGWGNRIKAVKHIKELQTDRKITLIEVKAWLAAISAYHVVGKKVEIDGWIERIIEIKENFKFDDEIINVCQRSILLIFIKHPSDYLGAVLIDIAEKIPWLHLDDDFPTVGFFNTQLVLESNDISQMTKNRALELKKKLEKFEEFKKNMPRAFPLPREILNELWAMRRFMPYWGKVLWVSLKETGETDWIHDALDDPWNLPEDRELLEKLLREHTGNKE